MRLKILLPVSVVLGMFAIQPALTNAAFAQASTTPMSQPKAKKAMTKKAAAKKAPTKKPVAKKAAAKKPGAKKAAKTKMS